MAGNKRTSIRRSVTSLVRPGEIRRWARACGAVRRERKVDIVTLVHALAFGFPVGNGRTFAGLRRSYQRAARTQLVPSAFYDRFTPGFAQLMRRVTSTALERSASHARPATAGALGRFREVVATDSTLLRLHECLRPLFPSVWTHHMPASLKLNVVMNVVGRGARHVRLAPGSTHDVRLLRCGPWMRGRLLLFDLAYFSGSIFTEVGRHGGYFLSRMRKHTNPRLIRSHRPEHRHLEGCLLRDVASRLEGDVFDFDVALNYSVRHGRRRVAHCGRFRLVGVRCETGELRFYLTNADPERLRPEHVAAVYAARWEIELLFRELKVVYRIEHTRTRNRHAMEALLFAALLSLLLSRRLRDWLAESRPEIAQRLTMDRWAIVLAAYAHDLLDILVGPRQLRPFLERRLKSLLVAEAQDPNLWRLQLPLRAQAGTLDTHRNHARNCA